MALYAIGDLHLSLSVDKPMDIFGDVWRGHTEKLRESFSHLTAEDTTVLCGDSSWGISLEESLEDFRFIDGLPGQKILLKGNHDYWWETAAKIIAMFMGTMPSAAPGGGSAMRKPLTWRTTGKF